MTIDANLAQGLLYPSAETYTLTRAIPMAFAVDNGWDRLSPTENQHSELGVSWQAHPHTSLEVSVFQDRISKRYIWSGFYAGAIVNPASGTWSNDFPTYHLNGLEASLKHQLNREWQMFVGLTKLDPSLENLPYAPKTALSTGLTGQLYGVDVAFDAQYEYNASYPMAGANFRMGMTIGF